MFGDNPPRWLGWANTSSARAITTIIAFVALVMSGFLAVRQQAYIECVAEQQARDSERTRAISAATDAEREADRELIAGPRPDGPTAEQLRAAAVAARAVTDRVRQQNPAPPMHRC